MSVDVAALERLARRAWPARETEHRSGWELRFADGFSRRANSVLPIGDAGGDVGSMVDEARRWYRARGLPLRFRMTPLAGPGVGGSLRELGFVPADETVVMAGALAASEHEVGDVVVTDTPDDSWVDLQHRIAGAAREPVAGWRGILERIEPPAMFASLGSSAAGMAVVDGDAAGFFQIVVAPARRRVGLGSALMDVLTRRAIAAGARWGWLQVQTSNTPALALYRGRGYREVYRYQYLVEDPSAVGDTC